MSRVGVGHWRPGRSSTGCGSWTADEEGDVREAVLDCCGCRCPGGAHGFIGRVDRLRRVELRERCRPDQDRRDHAADGELRAMGHSGTCRDGACDQRDQQDGRREGTGPGAEAQPRRRRRPVQQHERGDRRLPAADPAGERRRDRGHHRQPDRACDVTAGRGGEGAAVPREVGEQRDPDAVVAATRSAPACPPLPWSLRPWCSSRSVVRSRAWA